MVPKDCVTLVGNDLKIQVTNIIKQINTDMFPENFADLIIFKIDDEVVISKGNTGIIKDIKLTMGDKTIPFTNIQELGTIGSGTKITIIAPNVKDLKKGETHKFEFNVINDGEPKKNKKGKVKERKPVVITFEREIM